MNNEIVQNLYDQDGLLDILLGIEAYFDDMDLYAYKNWISGEVIDGPHVEKYWVTITLKYYNSNMPDPRGAAIFARQGTIVTVKGDFEYKPIEKPRSMEDMTFTMGNTTPSPVVKTETIPVLLFKFRIPRKLVNPESFTDYKIQDVDMDMSGGILNQDEDLDFDEEITNEPEQN